jgi:N6-adenosine-specific RNA methylase IME4
VNEIVNKEWYEVLVGDCKAIITEAVFTSRWALVEGNWNLGKRIREDNVAMEHAKGNKSFVQDLARNIGTSERSMYHALQLYDKFPDMDKIPEGKNISMNKLITKYLPEIKREPNILKPSEGKYNLIVIDPPWPYGTEYDPESRRVANPYDEVTVDELGRFSLPADDNCALFLWTTHKFLPDAFNLMKIWGFEYKITMVWDKQRLGMGAWLRCQAEFCLLGIKGKPTWELTNQRDLLSVARREHSRKPDEFYKMVETLCPVEKKIDIFSREKREGWDQYGNETDKLGK